MERHTKLADFRHLKTLDDFDWSFNPSVHKKEIFDLASCQFVFPCKIKPFGLEARVGIGRLIAPKTTIVCLILQGIQADCVTIGNDCFTLFC